MRDTALYRRLLWAYPGHYRRRHGAEIVTTLAEMAEAGGGRRAVTGQALHLIACGVRQRFRVRRRVVAVIAAALAAVALGGLGSVAGTWLGWQTAATAPSTADAGALASAAAGAVRPSVERWHTAMGGAGVNTTIHSGNPYDAGQVRAALVADGWRITGFTETAGKIVVGADMTSTIPDRDLVFSATRDGLSLSGDALAADGDPQHADLNGLAIDVTVDPNAAIRPLTIAGLLLGALGGWLVAAALSHRRRWWPAAITLAATAVPAFVGYCKTYQVMVYDTHAPNQYVADSLSDGIPAALVLASAVVAVLAAALAVARRDPAPAGWCPRPPT